MQFKVKGINIKISFSFFALLLLMLLNNLKSIVFISVITALYHEIVHLIFLSIFKCKPEKITLNIFGGNIIRKQNSKSTAVKETIINLSAPLINIISGTIIYIYNPFCLWGHVNIVLGFFNILPFYNFDGGNALKHICMLFFTEKTTDRIINLLSVLVIVALTVINVNLVIFGIVNISVIATNVYFVSVFLYKIFKK
jgi:Zn-dependent protease